MRTLRNYVQDFITQYCKLSDEVLNARQQTIIHGNASLKLLSYMHRIVAIMHRFAIILSCKI